jgi:hypothetical protein
MLGPEDLARINEIVAQRLERIDGVKREIAGETGDSSQYGGLFQTYTDLRAIYPGRTLNRQELRRFIEITSTLEGELGLGFNSVLEVWQGASQRRQLYRESHPDPKSQV